MFFGRQKLLARIMNVLHHNSLMITGERRIGKTTFLHHLKSALERDEGTEYKFFPVSTDLQGVPEADFFHALMTDVVETLKPRPETLSALRYRGDDDAYDGRDFSHDLQRVIEELKTLTGHNGGIFGLSFRPDGKVLASASADRTVKLWEVATGKRLDTLSQPLKEQTADIIQAA